MTSSLNPDGKFATLYRRVVKHGEFEKVIIVDDQGRPVFGFMGISTDQPYKDLGSITLTLHGGMVPFEHMKSSDPA